MKKLLLTLACAASLGLWMSCSDSNELDVTTHSADYKAYTDYEYGGTLTATYHYYDETHVGDEEPTDTEHDYYSRKRQISWDYDNNKPNLIDEWYWGEWKEENRSDDIATISWEVRESMETNVRNYDIDSDIFESFTTSTIKKQGNSYYFTYVINSYNRGSDTEKITVTGSLEGDTFTIPEFHKPTYEEGERPSDRDWYCTNIVFTKAK